MFTLFVVTFSLMRLVTGHLRIIEISLININNNDINHQFYPFPSSPFHPAGLVIGQWSPTFTDQIPHQLDWYWDHWYWYSLVLVLVIGQSSMVIHLYSSNSSPARLVLGSGRPYQSWQILRLRWILSCNFLVLNNWNLCYEFTETRELHLKGFVELLIFVTSSLE